MTQRFILLVLAAAMIGCAADVPAPDTTSSTELQSTTAVTSPQEIEIAAAIKAEFGYDITVTVDEKNRVTLSGEVPTEDDEERIDDFVEAMGIFDRVRSRIDAQQPSID